MVEDRTEPDAGAKRATRRTDVTKRRPGEGQAGWTTTRAGCWRTATACRCRRPTRTNRPPPAPSTPTAARRCWSVRCRCRRSSRPRCSTRTDCPRGSPRAGAGRVPCRPRGPRHAGPPSPRCGAPWRPPRRRPVSPIIHGWTRSSTSSPRAARCGSSASGSPPARCPRSSPSAPSRPIAPPRSPPTSSWPCASCTPMAGSTAMSPPVRSSSVTTAGSC